MRFACPAEKHGACHASLERGGKLAQRGDDGIIGNILVGNIVVGIAGVITAERAHVARHGLDRP